MNLDTNKCPSCGVPYLAHLGMTGVCEQLQAAKAEVERLEMAIMLTLDENRHLADGDDCTLLRLKRAVHWE